MQQLEEDQEDHQIHNKKNKYLNKFQEIIYIQFAAKINELRQI